MTKREKIKFYIFLAVFIPAAIFVIRDEIKFYKTTGCVDFFQKARPQFEKMPRGVSFTADALEYTCSWNKGKIVISLGAILMIVGGVLSKWGELKLRKLKVQSKILPPA